MRCKDKLVLITGAGVGIGRAAALWMARENAKIAINSRSDSGQAVADEINAAGGEAIFVRGQVQVPDDAKRMVDETIKAFGGLNVLVNNAGVVYGGSVDSHTIEEWDEQMAINVRGVFLVSHYVTKHMLEHGGGSIVMNSSVCGVKGLKMRAGYSASKGAVVALTKAMAADYVDKGIRVNCINPGTTLTPSLQGRINAFDDPIEAKKMFIARQPMGRLGESDEIAAGIVFFASDESSFCTGAILNIDGGLTI
jgi:meso-butanediol dehydrogenase/(S,S)-butanediol dehydrogenase/diacetyl reductase